MEPHTNTCTLRNIETDKTRRAHLMHLKKYTSDFITHPITFKTQFTKQTTKPDKQEMMNQNPTRRSSRIAEKMSKITTEPS